MTASSQQCQKYFKVQNKVSRENAGMNLKPIKVELTFGVVLSCGRVVVTMETNILLPCYSEPSRSPRFINPDGGGRCPLAAATCHFLCVTCHFLCVLSSFSPTDSKFATCSDDGTVRIWDFQRCHEERILRGSRTPPPPIPMHRAFGSL